LIVFHVGVHKTGATFLQECVFDKIENVRIVQNELCEFVAGFGGGSLMRVIIWSSLEGVKKVLKKLFPKSKCIIDFRRHGELVKSLYKQYIHKGNTREFESFFGEMGRG
jgi:hypothetical protein